MNGKALFVMALQAILFLSADSGLFAQTETTGAVAGTVSDPSGAAVPNATITLRDLARGNAQTTTSGAAGTYRLELLTPGDYVLTVKATGFELSEQRVIVSVGQWSTLDVKLNLGAQSGSVFVKEAAAPLIQAENGNVSATINETQTQNIPNPGNDITYIAQLGLGIDHEYVRGLRQLCKLWNFSGFEPFYCERNGRCQCLREREQLRRDGPTTWAKRDTGGGSRFQRILR